MATVDGESERERERVGGRTEGETHNEAGPCTPTQTPTQKHTHTQRVFSDTYCRSHFNGYAVFFSLYEPKKLMRVHCTAIFIVKEEQVQNTFRRFLPSV